MLPVFVINLDRSPDRLAFMQAQAERIGLTFERVAGVDGLDLPEHLCSQFRGTRLAAGEIGCYAAHLLTHERVVREGLPYAMILEDDVELTPHVMACAGAAIDAAPPSWDYIHLSGSLKQAVLSLARLPNGHHLIRHSRLPVNAGGYLISQQGAKKMLTPAPRIRPIDQEIRRAWLRNIDVWGVYPSPVVWNNAWPTTIGGTWRTEARAKNNWSQGLLSELRGVLYRARKLGAVGYLRCLRANLGFGLVRRLPRALQNDQNGKRGLVAPIVGPVSLSRLKTTASSETLRPDSASYSHRH
jgi:glycosyl transferase, family 25